MYQTLTNKPNVLEVIKKEQSWYLLTINALIKNNLLTFLTWISTIINPLHFSFS